MRLRFHAGPRAGDELTLDPARAYIIGRDVAADITIDDARVSRRHASVRLDAGAAVVEDLGSRNGTFIDGKPVTRPVRLVGGEVIAVGDTRMGLIAVAPATVAGAPPALHPRQPGPATVERAALRQSVGRANRIAAVSLGVVVVLVVAVGAVALTGGFGPGGPLRSDVIANLRPSTVLIQTDLGSGTGWVLDADAGLIVTNNHVINGAAEIVVGGEDAKERPATIVGTAPCEDLAVLRVADTSGLRTLELGSQASLRQGDDVLALGYPASAGPGDKAVATDGIVSVVNEEWTIGSADVPQLSNVIQTNADINPGNSGGPLVTMDGKLVGVNSAGITDIRGRTIQGQGYAIGVDRVKEVVPALSEGASWAWTGMGLEYGFRDVLEELELPDRRGMVVASATPGTPAAEVGFGEFPVLVVAIDGTAIDGTLTAYCELLEDRRSGDTATFTVVASGETQEQTVRVAFE